MDLIDVEVEEHLKNLVESKIRQFGGKLLAFGCTSDYIHLLIQLPPKANLSKVVGEIKGYSSFTLANQIYPKSDFRWQSRYSAMTVSRSALKRLTLYIENQRKQASRPY